MDKQTIFNTVANHLFQQGRPAKRSSLCSYRGDGGTKCSIGAIIPSHMYSHKMEGNSLVGLRDKAGKYELPNYITDKENTGLLRGLQGVHDGDSSWVDAETLRNRLYGVALASGVFPSILEGDGVELGKPLPNVQHYPTATVA